MNRYIKPFWLVWITLVPIILEIKRQTSQFLPVQTNLSVCFGASPGARIMPPTSKQMGNLFFFWLTSSDFPAEIRTSNHTTVHHAFCQIAIGDFASCNSQLGTCNWRCCTCAVSETSFCYFNLASRMVAAAFRIQKDNYWQAGKAGKTMLKDIWCL